MIPQARGTTSRGPNLQFHAETCHLLLRYEPVGSQVRFTLGSLARSLARTDNLGGRLAATAHLCCGLPPLFAPAPVVGEPRPSTLSPMASAAARGAAVRSPLLVHHRAPLVRYARLGPHLTSPPSPFYKGSPLRSRFSGLCCAVMRQVDADWGLLQVHPSGGGSLRVGWPGIGPGREGRRRGAPVGARVFARYSQAQDFSTRLQGDYLI